ncbi:MAG: endonuclease/exonuclease/phosphatase family protein [Salibacteraceae bacterium]
MKKLSYTIVNVLLLLIVIGALASFLAGFIPPEQIPVLQLIPVFDLLFLSIILLISVLTISQSHLLYLRLMVLLLVAFVFISNNKLPIGADAAENGSPTYRLVCLNVAQLSNDTVAVDDYVKKIRQLDPDFVFLQEFGLYYKWPDVTAMAQDFADQINMRYFDFTPKRGNIFGTALFSKQPISSIDTIFQLLSETNEAKRYSIDLTSAQLVVTNVHLMSYNIMGASSLSIERMSFQIDERTNQVDRVLDLPNDLILGDFNFPAGSFNYQRFTDRYADAYRGCLLPTHRFVLARLDHVFHSDNIRVLSRTVKTFSFSDHRALIVDFQVMAEST